MTRWIYLLLAGTSILAVPCAIFGGTKGLISELTGVTVISISVLGTWGLVLAISPGPPTEPRRILIIGLTALLIKFPLIFVSLKVLSGWGGPGLVCFALGGALVYCVLVGWAQARQRITPSD